MKVLIVDDEAPARSRLSRLLEKYNDLEVVGEASNGLSALNEIHRLSPDIVFLDIEMPELDGISVAETIKNNGPAVIFVTAYNEHALKAFEVAAVDYLVKPVIESRLEAAIEKVRSRKNKSEDKNYLQLIESLTNQQTLRRLAIRCGAKFIVLDPSKISAVIAKDHYAAIVVEGRELLADDSLDVLSARLNPGQFIRVHRSALINLEFLKELEREGDRKYLAVLNDDCKTRVPVSRERLNELKLKLGIN